MSRKYQRLWTKDEILIAINLYHKLSFGQLHSRNKTIIEVAEKLNRTPSSLALKLTNLAALDQSLDRKGMSNYSKLDREVWEEFYRNPEELIYKSENLFNKITDEDISFEEKSTEKITTIKSRVNQSFFRKTILASYDYKCCVSGVDILSFLVASHIKPWNVDEQNRLNPTNGLCLNSLYDKAFDKGFITINKKYEILISNNMISENNFIRDNFISIHKNKIILPRKFLPNQLFLEYHNDVIFQK